MSSHNNLSMPVVNFGIEVKEWVFQYDNVPKQTSRLIVKRFNDHTITQSQCYHGVHNPGHKSY